MFNLNKKNKKENGFSEGQEITLDKKIEALLFFKGEEMSLKKIAKNLGEKRGNVKKSLEILEERLRNSALILVQNGDKVLLALKSDFSGLIRSLIKDEEVGELSKPALETLAIVLYKGPISKIQLDEIRGINSAYILRNLLIRGLIEKELVEGRNLYSPTIDLMRFIGVDKKESLPAFEEVQNKLKKIEENND